MGLIGAKSDLKESDFDHTVRHWRFATSVQANAADFDKVLTECEGKITPALSKSIYRGVTEAMTNCAHHAYIEPRDDGTHLNDDPRWWMFSQELDGRLYVAFCDLGMGIPRSLPRIDGTAPGWMEVLNKYLNPFKREQQEAALIKAAIEIGRSRTRQAHRGLGLQQIIEAVNLTTGSNVHIFSNKGSYELAPNRLIKERLVQFNDSIMGTLIQWSMPIQEREDTHGEDRDH